MCRGHGQPRRLPRSNPEVPADLSDLVMQLLAKKPEERPQSAKVVAEALQEIEGQTGEKPAAPGARPRKGKGGGTNRTEAARTQVGRSAKRRPPLPWLVGGGVLGLGVLAAAIVLFWPTPQGRSASRAMTRVSRSCSTRPAPPSREPTRSRSRCGPGNTASSSSGATSRSRPTSSCSRRARRSRSSWNGSRARSRSCRMAR